MTAGEPNTAGRIASGQTIGHKKFEVFPRVQAQEIEIHLNTPEARISSVTAYLTGSEGFPELEPPAPDERRGERIG